MPDISSLNLFLLYFWEVIKAWWWILLPFLLWKPLKFFWLWWRVELWLKTTYKPVLLEIKIPKEVVKPIRAMENVLAGIWQATWEPPNWVEKWWEGQIQLGVSFEIVSIGGDIHFYIRCHQKYRDPIEANIYSQYPEAEISLADDYTKYVPQDIPNKDWELWGADYKFLKPDPYPILTYKKFETEHEALEEKRVDPVAALLENLAKIKPGEQLWIQIGASSISENYVKSFHKQGEEIRDKLAKRPEKPKQKSMIQEAAGILITGKPPGEEVKEEAVFPPELRLTPGEREIVEGVENKIGKPVFKCNIRFIYLGKREVWFKPNLRLAFGFFANYFTSNMNALVPHGKTMTKVKKPPPLSLLNKRRMYLRQRKIFRQYKERFDPYFPRDGRWPAVFILSIEEMASLFHFPSWRIAPTPGVPRVEARKGAPPELPIE